jgi:hypothetical protein
MGGWHESGECAWRQSWSDSVDWRLMMVCSGEVVILPKRTLRCDDDDRLRSCKDESRLGEAIGNE